MVLEEVVKVLYWFLKVSTLIKHSFWDSNKCTIFVCDNCSSSGHIIDQRYLSEGISRIVINSFLFSPIFLTLSLNHIHSFKHNIEILPLISLLKDNLILLMRLQLKIDRQFAERCGLEVKRFFDKDHFLNYYCCTLRMLMSSSFS